MHQLARVLGGLSRLALWLAAASLVVMTAIVGWQVWGRYVLNSSPNWTEAVTVLLMSWFIFLGAAVGTREGFHLSFDLVTHLVPPGVQAAMHTVSDAVVLVFGAGMVIYGGQLAAGTWASTMPALGISGGLAFVPLIAGGVLVALFSAERLARRAAGLPTVNPASAGHAPSEV